MLQCSHKIFWHPHSTYNDSTMQHKFIITH